MTVYQSKVEAMSFFKETAFGTDYSASYASFQQIPFVEGSAVLTLERNVETPGHAQQRLDGYPIGVLMPKRATLDFSCNLETMGTKAASTVAATHTWLTRMLEIGLGSVHQVTGTTASVGWTTSTGDVAVDTTLRGGAAIGAVYSTTGAFEAREIESNDGSNTIVLKLALSEAPSTSEVMYGSTTLYTSTRTTGYNPSGQFLVQGWNVEDRWLLMGGVCTVSLTIAPGGIARLNFKWQFADWDQADGSATAQDLTGAVLSASTYSDTNTLVVVDSEFRVQTVGTATLSGTLYHPSEISFEPNITFVPVMSPAGVNNIVGWVRTHVPPVLRGSFTLPYEDSQEWFTARDSKTAKMISYQIGSSIASTAGAVLISAPTVQITNVQRADLNGVLGQKVEWAARHDTDVTETSGYEGLGESAFRIHFF